MSFVTISGYVIHDVVNVRLDSGLDSFREDRGARLLEHGEMIAWNNDQIDAVCRHSTPTQFGIEE